MAEIENIRCERAVSTDLFEQNISKSKEMNDYLEMPLSETIFQYSSSDEKTNDDTEEESERDTTFDGDEAEILQLTKDQSDLLSSNQKWDSDGESLDENSFEAEEYSDNFDDDEWEKEHCNDDALIPCESTTRAIVVPSNVVTYIQLNLPPNISFQGLRLSNYKNDCYLNSALNGIVTNPILMKHIQTNSDLLETWIREILAVHSPSSYLPWDATKDEIMAEWQMFLSSPIECITEHGGMECYEAIKEEYERKTKQANIIDEIQRLRRKGTSTSSKIESARQLKTILGEYYPYMECYSNEIQEDASTPFLHMVESIPNLVEKFQILGQKTRKCLMCGREEIFEDATNMSIYLGVDINEGLLSVQRKVDDWCNSLTEIEKKCECTIYKNDSAIQEMYKKGTIDLKEESMTNTAHEEKFEVVDVPKILYIRKPMANKDNEDMEIQESLTINDTTYYLKTALLYTGSGSFGHWRALSREGEIDLQYVLYNDASEPKQLKPNEELGYLQLATDFIYVQDEILPKKKPIEIDKNAKDSESVLDSYHQETKTEIVKSLEEYFSKMMDRNGAAQINIYV